MNLKDYGFMENMIKLPFETRKSSAWMDAFKGEGAYYTLKNLVMFHDCIIYETVYSFGANKTTEHRGIDAVKYINHKLYEYQGEGWRMFALMKKVISDNGINTKTYIADIVNK